jgi:ATP-binding cassette, subfamily B, bacterial
MDSWAETDWLERFRRLAAGRTVIIITHRFTTAMRADIIHVMADGQIVESGCHQKLLAHGGRYAQSWTAQMQEINENASLEEGSAFSRDGTRRHQWQVSVP